MSTRFTFTFGPPRPVPPRNLGALPHVRAYHALRADGIGRKGSPWTREAVLLLGRPWYAGQGTWPNKGHFKDVYGLPNYRTVLRLFGSLETYLAVCQEEAP